MQCGLLCIHGDSRRNVQHRRTGLGVWVIENERKRSGGTETQRTEKGAWTPCAFVRVGIPPPPLIVSMSRP
jgi:hypothetical protein